MPKRPNQKPDATVKEFVQRRMSDILKPRERPKPENLVEAIQQASNKDLPDITPLMNVLTIVAQKRLEPVMGLMAVCLSGKFADPNLEQVKILAAGLKCSFPEFQSLLGLAEAEAGKSLVPESMTGEELKKQYEEISAQADAAYGGNEGQGPLSQKAAARKNNPRGRGKH